MPDSGPSAHRDDPTPRDEVEAAALAWLDRHDDELIGETAALLRIPSVEGPAGPGAPFGAEVARALGFVEALARQLGLDALGVDGYAVHAHWGPPERLVGVLTHVDVVPAGDGWSVPPFGGVVRDGRLYGRGAIDNKGPTVAALFAVAALAAVGAPVRRGMRLIVGGDEESGFECLRHYFRLHPYPELAFSPDAVFPVVFAEKGILDVTVALPAPTGPVVRLSGGERPNVVPDRAEAELAFDTWQQAADWQRRLTAAAASRRAWIEVELIGPVEGVRPQVAGEPAGRIVVRSRGLATHGSTPEKGINAAVELLTCLVEADRGEGVLDPAGSLALLAAAGAGLHGQGLGIFERDDVSGVLSCNLGVLELKGPQLVATFDIRYPVSLKSGDSLVRRMGEKVASVGGRVTAVIDDPPHYVPEESFIVRTLLEVYRRETDDDTPPLAIGGGTYARLVPGAVAFGPVMPFSGVVPHERDEHIELDHLRRLARLYAAALWALAR